VPKLKLQFYRSFPIDIISCLAGALEPLAIEGTAQLVRLAYICRHKKQASLAVTSPISPITIIYQFIQNQ
jgi:hypothetical protein